MRAPAIRTEFSISKLYDLVFRAADELYASETALTEAKANHHRLMADELIKLIRLDGNELAYRVARTRDERRAGIDNEAPLAHVITVSPASV